MALVMMMDTEPMDNPDTLHVHVHIRGPMWWTMLRYAAYLPLRLYRSLDDQVAWHRIRGHNVSDGLIVGEDAGPLHMWDHYCHTCEVAW